MIPLTRAQDLESLYLCPFPSLLLPWCQEWHLALTKYVLNKLINAIKWISKWYGVGAHFLSKSWAIKNVNTIRPKRGKKEKGAGRGCKVIFEFVSILEEKTQCQWWSFHSCMEISRAYVVNHLTMGSLWPVTFLLKWSCGSSAIFWVNSWAF